VVSTLSACGTLLGDRTYLGLVLVAGTSMAALFAYVCGSSFVLQEHVAARRRRRARL
jgi:DHA1 family bicyclomycin/chloramphenicol resistance-like MFS transporter